MIVVGERLNSTRKAVAEALAARDEAALLGEARRQHEAGAAYVDVNAAMLRKDEPAALTWLVPLIQEAIPEALIAVDSPGAGAVRAGFEAHRGRPLLNSITGERERMDAMLPLVEEFRPRVVALAMDDGGISQDAEQRFTVAARLVEVLSGKGLAPDDIFVDPLIIPVSAQPQAGVAALDLISRLRAEFPGIHVICGLSNVSFGLPVRRGINRVFLTMAMSRGLDAAILDPLDARLMAAILTAEMLLGQDRVCRRYLTAFREGRIEG